MRRGRQNMRPNALCTPCSIEQLQSEAWDEGCSRSSCAWAATCGQARCRSGGGGVGRRSRASRRDPALRLGHGVGVAHRLGPQQCLEAVLPSRQFSASDCIVCFSVGLVTIFQ